MGVCVSVKMVRCVMRIFIRTCVYVCVYVVCIRVYLNAKKREGASAKVYRYLNASRRLSIVVELIVFLNYNYMYARSIVSFFFFFFFFFFFSFFFNLVYYIGSIFHLPLASSSYSFFFFFFCLDFNSFLRILSFY